MNEKVGLCGMARAQRAAQLQAARYLHAPNPPPATGPKTKLDIAWEEKQARMPKGEVPQIPAQAGPGK